MNRRVLVTGAASGLGACLVDLFVARGDTVLATDRTPDYTPPDGTSYLQLDVTSDSDWAAAALWVEEHWGGLDVLVNNAGVATGGRIDVATLDEWRSAFDINLLGVVRGCRTFVPVFKAQRGGHIVNTASLAGLVHPPAMGSYTALKAAVVALSETLFYELSPFGITTTVVCPGFFRTNLAASLNGSDTAVDAVAARLIEKSPVTADQVAVQVMSAIDRRKSLSVPDRRARLAILTKKFARPLYDLRQRAMAERIESAVMKRENA